jgi:predicted RNase H-like HicB family nuclease
MELPIALHKDEGSVYGVTVPDVPGCYSWGDTIDQAMRNAKQAIYSHFEAVIENGGNLDISPSSIEELSKSDDFQGVIWALVDIDASKIDAKPERINISVPRFVLKKIDSHVQYRHETRSGFLSRAALEAIAKELDNA